MIFNLIYGFSCDTAVQGYKINAVLRVQTNNINKILRGKSRKIALIVNNTVIYWYRAYHGGAFTRELAAERLCVTVAGKVHYSLRAHIYRAHNLLHFNVIIFAVSRNAEVYIDFCAQHTAYALCVKAGVKFVCGNGDLTLCHKFRQPFNRHILFFGNCFNLRGNDAFSCRIHLSCVSHLKILRDKK